MAVGQRGNRRTRQTMSKRFVVDFKIAAAEQASLFTPEWRWPVPQSSYDNPLREFVERAYTLPAKLSHVKQLRGAFELVELDLLKDLVAALTSWIDVDASRKQNLNIVHGDTQRFYKMFTDDTFVEYSMIEELRAQRYKTLRSKIGRSVRRFGKNLRFTRLDGRRLGISPNVLTNQIAPADTPLFRIDDDTFVRRGSIDKNTSRRVEELANEISNQINTAFSRNDQDLTRNGIEYITRLISRYLAAGITDQRVKLPVNSSLDSIHLYTGSGGIYQSRLAAHLVHRAGGTVTRTTHGGDTVLFKDPFWVGMEVTGASHYITYGSTSADIIGDDFSNHPRAAGIDDHPQVAAAGSQYHRQLVESATPSTSIQPGANVVVVSASFTGELRPTPHVKIHDVPYLEWHTRLLQMIKNAGYKTISKRHPKGMAALQPLFTGSCDIELTGIGMNSIETGIDGWVTDIAASAFLEAMCSLKPVVLIDIPTRRMTELARQRISESVQIVKATFDDANRVIIDSNDLTEALEKPFDLDARRRFLDDFLLAPSSNYSSIIS